MNKSSLGLLGCVVAAIPFLGCLQEARLAEAEKTDAAIRPKDPDRVRLRMEQEMEAEYGPGYLEKSAATAGNIGYLKGSTSCVSGTEVRILIDEMDYGVSATTHADKVAGVSQQYASSRLWWNFRNYTGDTFRCANDNDVANLNYPAFSCVAPQGLQGIQRYPAYPGYASSLDTEFRFCKDFVTWLPAAKNNYAVAQFYKNDNEARCGCPFPSHSFSVDFPSDQLSGNQIVGGASPTFASSSPDDFVRMFFCFRETDGTSFVNPWGNTARLGKVGVFSGGPDEHWGPWNVQADQGGPESAYQGMWELHPVGIAGNRINKNVEYRFYDCQNEFYWTLDKQAQVTRRLFHTMQESNGFIYDIALHTTWRGPN